MANKSVPQSPVLHTRDMFSIENAAPQIHNPELGVRRVQIDGVWFFSILDIFKLYGETSNPTVEWAQVESFLIKQGAIDPLWQAEGSMKIIGLRTYQFEGKGQRKTPIGTFKMIMRIAQVTTFKGWESARDQMAQLAEERVEEIHNPELGVRRSHERYIKSKMKEGLTEVEALRALADYIESATARIDLMTSFKEACIEELTRLHYAEATNVQYTELFGMKASEIADRTGVKPAKQGLTPEGKQTLLLVDMVITRKFRENGKLPYKSQLAVMREVCHAYGITVRNIEQTLGISLVTGLPLLSTGAQS